MTTVTLHGELGRTIGETWELLIEQPREALALIEANTKKFYQYLRDVHERSDGEVRYRVVINGKDHEDIAELYLKGGELRTIDIIPVPAGGGLSGVWQAIVGVVLIVVGVAVAYFAGWTGIGATIGLQIGLAGLAMTLGGVAQMLSPAPKLGQNPATARVFKPEENDEPVKAASYLFGGALNTTRQGNPVPLCYGEMIVGSQVIGMGISGRTIDGKIIGDQRPPPPHDAFLDTPIFAILAAQDRAQEVEDQSKVKQMAHRFVLIHRLDFDLPNVNPFTGKGIGGGEYRDFLKTLSYLFNGPMRQIQFREIIALYRVLGLTTIADLRTATWEEVVLAVANYYGGGAPAPDVTAGLVARWKFDEGTGISAADSAGLNAGTINGGATWVAGKIGAFALSLDGVNDYTDVGAGLSISIAGTKSIAFWIKPSTGAQGDIFSNYNAAGNTAQWSHYRNTNGSVDACPFDGPGSGNYKTWSTAAGQVPDNIWTHVVITYDGTIGDGACHIYINGLNVSLTPNTNGSVSLVTSGYGNCAIGRSGSFSGNYLGMSIDHFSIYNRELTASEAGVLFAYHDP